MSTTIDQLDMSRFEQETRDFANECFTRFERTNLRTLTYSTPRADQETLNLLRTGLPKKIRDAEAAGDISLAHHYRALLDRAPKKHTLDWLLDLSEGRVS